MNNPPIPEWTRQNSEAHFALPGKYAATASTFERTIRRRNFIEYAVGAVVIVVFGWVTWLTASRGDWLMAVGWAALVIGTIAVMANMARIAGNLERRPEMDCVSHLRSQLDHQRRALLSVMRWYMAPLIPGMIIVMGARAMEAADKLGTVAALTRTLPSALFVVAVFIGIRWLNHRAAHKLADEIAELDRMGPGTE